MTPRYNTRPIGQKFVLKDRKGIYLIKVIKAPHTGSLNQCNGCEILNITRICTLFKQDNSGRGECRAEKRTDQTAVIFKQLKFKPYGKENRP